MSTLAAGDRAPEFALPDATGTVHRLADRRDGYTVVYFYPRDDSPGCTVEACQFRDEHEAIAAEDAAVWGISPDDGASHDHFRTKFGLPFTLLSDVDHAVADAYGAWGLKVSNGKESIGLIRSTVLVGPDLEVVRTWPKVSPDGHAAEVLEAIREARAARVGGSASGPGNQ